VVREKRQDQKMMKEKDRLVIHKIHPQLVGRRSNGLQSIHRAVSILRVVSKNNDRGIRLSSICGELELKTSTAHRLLSSLVAEGMVTYDPFLKLYHLGFELHKLGGAAYQYSIIEYCQDAMEKIAKETGDTTFLSMRLGASGVCLKRVEGAYPVRTLTIEEGSRVPLGAGASSLAILANLPNEVINQVLAFNKRLYAHYHSQNEADLVRLIKRTRNLGYALYDRIVNHDVVAVGLPVFDQRGEVVAGISVATIPSRMARKRREKIVRLIKSVVSHVRIPARSPSVLPIRRPT